MLVLEGTLDWSYDANIGVSVRARERSQSVPFSKLVQQITSVRTSSDWPFVVNTSLSNDIHVITY